MKGMTAEERKSDRLAKALVKALANIEAASDVSPDILNGDIEIYALRESQGVKGVCKVLIEHWGE